MPVDKGQRSLASLLSDISERRLRLPEIQRSYVWKPTQVANLIQSLYRGYPTGSLLLWKTKDEPQDRAMSIGAEQRGGASEPLYLLDGQQRLTSMFRAIRRDDRLDPSTFIEVVFNVESDEFQNQSAATRRDRRWVRVAEVVDKEVDLFDLAETVHSAVPDMHKKEIGRRLQRLHGITDHQFHVETLTDFDYKTVAEIFVRVNSGGRALRLSDLALATLSARWPGVVSRFEQESDFWARNGYPAFDENFLTRALTAAVLGRGLSQWSHDKLVKATDEKLNDSWAVVRAGLKRLVPILKDAGVEHSSLVPSLNALVPLVMLLGSRSSDRLDEDTRNGIVYCFFVSTVTGRYGGSADSILSRDIPAALSDEPVRALLNNMGYTDKGLVVDSSALVGRTVTSPYFFMSFLACWENEATDWWDRNRIALVQSGKRSLEYHHIHPQKTIKDNFQKAQVNDIANLAFVSAAANRRISDRSPRDYFDELSEQELAGHFIPRGSTVEASSGYLAFLERRRTMLTDAINVLMNKYRPSWMTGSHSSGEEESRGLELLLASHQQGDERARLSLIAQGDSLPSWSGRLLIDDLISALEAAEDGLSSDVQINSELEAVVVQDDLVSIAIGPLLVFGTVAEWRSSLQRELLNPLPYVNMPDLSARYEGPLHQFHVVNSE